MTDTTVSEAAADDASSAPAGDGTTSATTETPTDAAVVRSPWGTGGPPRAADIGPAITRAGAKSARVAATRAEKVSDRLATAVTRTGGTPAQPGQPPERPAEAGIAGQVLNLGFQFAQVFSYGVFRFLELLAGPLEQLIDPDPIVVDDVHLVLGPVIAGQQVRGSFELDNASAHDAEISVVLPNALASVRGQIPVERVALTPNPISVPAHGAASVRVTVSVPTSTEAGRYMGIVRSDEVPNLTLILEVEVASGVSQYQIAS